MFWCCSFTWSSEKINLNMIQVITGHLVKSFDEEFRTLYARSCVPADLCVLDGSLPHILPKSAKKIEGKDLRHALDTVCRKTHENTMIARDYNHGLLEEERNEAGPLSNNEIPNPISQFFSTEPVDLKRHSYAGEIQERNMQQNIWPRGSNWNIYQEKGHAANKYLVNNNNVQQRSRGQNANPYGDQTGTMLQTPPTLDNTSKSYMRTLRIESYLRANDVPFRDACNYLDEYEQLEKSSRIMQSRMRSSLVFRPNMKEQIELNRHMSYTGPRPLAAPNTPVHFSSMQWNPAMTANQMSNEEFMLKKQNLQNLDNRNGPSYGQGRNVYPPGYASLGRAKGGAVLANPDARTELWHKRHSMADPGPNFEHGRDFSGNIFEDFAGIRINRSITGRNAQIAQNQSNLNEEQRSVSHCDVKGIVNRPNMWQDPPSRTVSAAALHPDETDFTPTSNTAASQQFPKKTSNKINSLLNIPEKKEEAGMAETYSCRSASSTATITAEDESPESQGRYQKPPKSLRSSLKQRGKWSDGGRSKSCKTQLVTVEQQRPNHHSVCNKGARTDVSADDKNEPYSSTDKSHSLSAEHSQNNSKSLVRGAPDVELKVSARGHHENKLERFLQRMGNLLHKNK